MNAFAKLRFLKEITQNMTEIIVRDESTILALSFLSSTNSSLYGLTQSDVTSAPHLG